MEAVSGGGAHAWFTGELIVSGEHYWCNQWQLRDKLYDVYSTPAEQKCETCLYYESNVFGLGFCENPINTKA